MGQGMRKQNNTPDRFGINIKRYCREHEAAVRAEPPTPEGLEAHLLKLRWLQHERLVHLIVLAMVVLAELFVVDLALLHPQTNPLAGIIMMGLAVLLAFYFYHYFFLENTVQRWYRLADQIREALRAEPTNGGQAGRQNGTMTGEEDA